MTGFTAILRALVLSTVRDRTALFFTILFPLIFLVIIGGVFSSSSVPQFKVVEVGSVGLVDNLSESGRASVDEVLALTRASDMDSALAQVRSGDAAAAIEQRGNQIVIHTTGADPTAAGAVRSVIDALILADAGSAAPYSVAVDQVEDQSLRTIQYLTPGMLGWAIATGATFTAAQTLVLWRRGKLLRRLTLSPVRVPAIIAARLVVSLVLALVQTVVFVAVAAAFFGLRLEGSWWMAIPLVLAGTLAFLSVGLLAGAKAKSVETATVIANLVVIPMAFLSGSFFSLSTAPQWIQRFAEVLPLRHLNAGMLALLTRDASAASVLPELGVLLGFALVLTLLAARMFRWDDI
jgi:ABC-2 type transport system permease protein